MHKSLRMNAPSKLPWSGGKPSDLLFMDIRQSQCHSLGAFAVVIKQIKSLFSGRDRRARHSSKLPTAFRCSPVDCGRSTATLEFPCFCHRIDAEGKTAYLPDFRSLPSAAGYIDRPNHWQTTDLLSTGILPTDKYQTSERNGVAFAIGTAYSTQSKLSCAS